MKYFLIAVCVNVRCDRDIRMPHQFFGHVDWDSGALKVYVCNVMTQDGETEGYTAADYVREQAESQAVQQAVIRKWAKDVNVTLTEEDQAALQAQKDAYGADLEKALKLNGISEAQYDQLMNTSALYNRLYAAYCGADGEMRPSDSAPSSPSSCPDTVKLQGLPKKSCE